MILPDLYHYYERSLGPFRSLSDLDPQEAERVLEGLRRRGDVFASRRASDYLTVRRELEGWLRGLFTAKGGQPARRSPHYLTLGPCEWLMSWYRQPAVARLALAECDPAQISFTYGDAFPALRVQDGRPYRGQVYTLSELPEIVRRFGLPQEWNPDGKHGPERYIEAQLWQEIDGCNIKT